MTRLILYLFQEGIKNVFFKSNFADIQLLVCSLLHFLLLVMNRLWQNNLHIQTIEKHFDENVFLIFTSYTKELSALL